MTAPHRDDAAIRITENGQATIHYLGAKLRRPHAPRKPETNYTWQSADFSTRRTVTIASTARDLRAQLRYEGQPHQLEEMLAAGMRGATMEYFPSISNPSEVYPFDLIEHSDVAPDPSRWFEHRYSVADVLLRRRDGGTWDGVLTQPLFYWLAGNTLPGLTFTRSSVGTAIDEDGVLQTYAADIIREEWIDTNGDGKRDTPTWLLEETRTNLVLQSEDFSTTWATVGSPTINSGAGPHTAAGVSLDLLGDNDGAASEYFTQDITFTSDGNRTVSLFVREGESPPASGSLIVLRDTTAGVSRLSATVTWAGGVPSVALSTGTELESPERLTDGVYRLHLRATGVIALNNNQVQVRPTTATASETGDIYAGGVQAENSVLVSSYIPTTTGTVARPADTLYFGFDRAPQEGTLYLKLRARQASGTGSDNTVVHAGSATSGADPRLLIFDGPSGYRAAHDNGDAAVTTPDTLSAASVEDDVELRLDIRSDGSLVLGQSIAEAAEETTAATAANALEGAWADTRLYLNSQGTSQRSLNRYLAAKWSPESGKSMATMRDL